MENAGVGVVFALNMVVVRFVLKYIVERVFSQEINALLTELLIVVISTSANGWREMAVCVELIISS